MDDACRRLSGRKSSYEFCVAKFKEDTYNQTIRLMVKTRKFILIQNSLEKRQQENFEKDVIGLNENQRQLAVIDGETLMDMRLPPTRFCVETLLPQGVSILGGAPKIGKSWLVLDLCIHVAKGEPLWNLPTQKGTTLYLCLEDSLRRVQERLCRLTDEVPGNSFFATAAGTLADGLREQVGGFVKAHPDTVLVVIDTFQIIRANNAESSYAGDYEEGLFL